MNKDLNLNLNTLLFLKFFEKHEIVKYTSFVLLFTVYINSKLFATILLLRFGYT